MSETTGVNDTAYAIRTSADRLAHARDDFLEGVRRRELWIYLGWRDVKKRYQRSLIGPFWLTLSMGILVGSLGLLYSQIFGLEVKDYLPYLAVGFILWGFISQTINQSCAVFSSAAAAIRQIRLPLSIYIFEFVWQQLIILGHNFLIYIVVALVFAINPGWETLLLLPALAILTLNAAFCALIFGPLCARFRDIPMIVQSIVQVSFFLTPIIWHAEQIPERAVFVAFNPFYHLIEIARDPLLGQPVDPLNWIASIGITLVIGTVSVLFFARYRSRIAYWA